MTLYRSKDDQALTKAQTPSASPMDIYEGDMLDRLMRFAEVMTTSTVIPKHFQGSPGNCLAVAMQSAKWGMDPFEVARKTHIVSGVLGYEAQLVNAVVSSSKAIAGRFKYEWDGDSKCKAGAVIRGESEITWGQWVVASKQTTKNSPLWKTDPQQQLAYLAVKKWCRLYTPDVLLGVYTPDEIAEIDITADGSTIKESIEKSFPQAQRAPSEKKEQEKSADTSALVEAFEKIGVSGDSLMYWIKESDLNSATDKEVDTLRAIYKDIKAGKSTIADYFVDKETGELPASK